MQKINSEVEKPIIVWFRQDLRLEDNPALTAAIHTGRPVIPLFIWDLSKQPWSLGAASRWWLHYSLISLKTELKEIGLNLILQQSHSPLQVILSLAKETNANLVYWNRLYEPHSIASNSQIKFELEKLGVGVKSFNGTLLFEPWTIANQQQKPFQVFTPFWKTCCKLGEPELPLPKPQKAKGLLNIQTTSIEELQLLPKIHWDTGIKKQWKPGSKEACRLLKYALEYVIENYAIQRDFPAELGTSLLSPYLHWGEISSRMIWHAVRQRFGFKDEVEKFLRQLGWREFAFHLLYHFPHTTDHPLREKFNDFVWKTDPEGLKAWQNGLTGYPIVDAGMRQLWHIGWMHNRLRMIVGSFLVKDLLINWQEGAKWFWDTLVDADLANNTLGWQWVGGCGADAAPYFRVFNPVLQGEKFDPQGKYVRQWIPELKNLSNQWIHKPWEAPQSVLRDAGVELGKNYPLPIVDHAEAKKTALETFSKITS